MKVVPLIGSCTAARHDMAGNITSLTIGGIGFLMGMSYKATGNCAKQLMF